MPKAETKDITSEPVEYNSNSKCQKIYRNFQQGKINNEEMLLELALATCEFLNEYRPALCPVISGELQLYVKQRAIGIAEHEPVVSKKLGDWLHVMRTGAGCNEEAMKDLTQDIEMLKAAGFDEQATLISRKLNEYQTSLISYPLEFIKDAAKVQKLDSELH